MEFFCISIQIQQKLENFSKKLSQTQGELRWLSKSSYWEQKIGGTLSIYNLGKPLSDDIDTLSTSLYESIMSESVEG